VTFEEYLADKKIETKAFSGAEPNLWQEWEREFAELHPTSFTSQKLYLINKIRRQFPLAIEPPTAASLLSEEEGKRVRFAKPIRPKIN